MLRWHKQSSQRGDTIVEVMVVLAVLGLAIGLAYATANRSLLQTRAAQENSQATELLQGQLEQLMALSTLPSSDPNYIFNTGRGNFCINTGGNIQPTTPSSNCTIGNLYLISITYQQMQGPDQIDQFTATATWPDVSGQGTDSSTLVYRIHAP